MVAKRPLAGERLEELWRRLDRRLREYAARRVGTGEDAEDIVQEIYLKIHAKLTGLREPERIDGWIFRVAHNTIIDYYRRRSRTLPLHEEIAVEPPEPESGELKRRLDEMVSEMVMQLPPIYRDAVRLADLEGLRQEEAARRLGISLSGMKSRVQRGRRLLKRMLLDCCHFQFDRRGQIIDYSPRCARCCSREGCA